MSTTRAPIPFTISSGTPSSSTSSPSPIPSGRLFCRQMSRACYHLSSSKGKTKTQGDTLLYLLSYTCENGYQKDQKQVLERMWSKRKPHILLLGIPVWRCFKILKIDLLWSRIPFLDINAKNTKTLISKYICIPMFTTGLYTITKLWQQPKCPRTKAAD